jgi:hypothetical protein
MFGPDTPVSLRLVELPKAIAAAEGVALELDDFAFSAADDVRVLVVRGERDAVRALGLLRPHRAAI